MRRFKFFGWQSAVLALGLLVTASCSDDDEGPVVVAPTCSDGIMNGNETGIDCGGSCDPCMNMPGRRAELYVTNNANGNITKYYVEGDSMVTFTTSAMAAEGIYYDATDDLLVQANRTDMQLDAYSGTGSVMSDMSLTADFSSPADLESPREIAVNGNIYVVADNGSNRFYVYNRSDSAFTLMNTVEVPFLVWGVAFKGDDLYAVVDASSDLAVYYDFPSNVMDGTMYPSKRVTIEGIVRTHGLVYDGTDDVMIMTDIGDAANTTDDGGFHVIDNFSAKFDALSDGDVLSVSMQTRVAGSATMMGNPIDVAYDSEEDAVYISDIGTGKVLGFMNIGNGGNLSPTWSKDLASASSIYFSSDETDGNTGNSSMNMMTMLYTTSNADGNVRVYDAGGVLTKTIMTNSSATEGIFYSGTNDALIQASRSGMMLQYFSDFSGQADNSMVTADFMSGADLMNPREIAVSGDKVVVSDTDMHEFYVYSYDGSSFTLENTFSPGFDVWGITFMGDHLLAVVDNDSDLAIFMDFLDNDTDGPISPDKRITIGGIVRTHGIDYSEAADILVMTDIGDAANTTDDGAFHVIENFTEKLEMVADGGTLSASDQIRFAGAATMMGNPIDIAYDATTMTVFIAEVGNGKILGFTDVLNASGNVAPAVSNDVASASSLYLYSN
jgi:hypothetical protein